MSRRRSLATWWHLLSLDAPTVAVVWCLAFAYAGHVSLPWSTPFLLGLATWIAYVGDRVLDARLSRDPSKLRDRHHFYGELWHGHRRLVVSFLVLAMGSAVVFGAIALPRELIIGYAALSAASFVYFAAVHWGGAAVEKRLPKEAAVGVIFAIGSALPGLIGATPRTRDELAPEVLVFAVVCWLNCVAIERWEAAWYTAGKVLGDAHRSSGHRSSRWASNRLGALLLVGLGACVCLAVYFEAERPFAVVALLLGVSFALLYAVERRHQVLHARQTRILADAVLLTPLLLLGWLIWKSAHSS